MKRKFNINLARQTNGNLCNKSMFRRKCRYFKAFRSPPSLFHRAPLPNSFVLNINYFPTTLEMLSATDLPRSRKSMKYIYPNIYTPFQGLVGEIPMKKKKEKPPPPFDITYQFHRLYEFNFLPLCVTQNVEQVAFFD